MYLISIITVNLNNAIGLEKTIKSIGSQTYKNIEFIIIDGNSQDESQLIINKYSQIITKCVSEKDNGLYDGMNKSLDLATGDFIMFLNSGDTFYNDSSLKKTTLFISDREKVYFGRAINIYKNNPCYMTPSYKINDNNYQYWLQFNFPNHQAMFFPRSFYTGNKYDLSYKISSDYDYKRRAFIKHEFEFVDEILINFELGGISSIPNSFKLVNRILIEIIKISKKYDNFSYSMLANHIFRYYTKYCVFNLFGEERYFKFLNKILK